MIKNIIFDLGGVIVRIDFNLTIKSLAKLANKTFSETKDIMVSAQFYDRVERGEFTRQEFILYIKECLNITASDVEIENAWNALLIEVDINKMNLVKELSSKFKLYVLSNTSELHIDGLNRMIEDLVGVSDLKSLFVKTFYSFDIGLRKPELDIYKYCLLDEDLDPKETLFIDDNMDNINSADQIGIKTLHVTDYDTETVLSDFLKNLR